MIDYLNPSHIPLVNSCVSCGAEMPEWNQVCKACVESWTIKADEHAIKQGKPRYFINDKELDCDKAYDWFQEAINEKAEREKATTQESLPVQRKSAESAIILQDYFESVRHRRELRVWLTEQIAQETDQARLETLKKMKSKYE